MVFSFRHPSRLCQALNANINLITFSAKGNHMRPLGSKWDDNSARTFMVLDVRNF